MAFSCFFVTAPFSCFSCFFVGGSVFFMVFSCFFVTAPFSCFSCFFVGGSVFFVAFSCFFVPAPGFSPMAFRPCVNRTQTHDQFFAQAMLLPFTACHEATRDNICHHHSPCHGFLAVQLWPLRFLLLLKPMAKKHARFVLECVSGRHLQYLFHYPIFLIFFYKKELCMSTASIPKERKLSSLRITTFSAFFWRANADRYQLCQHFSCECKQPPGLHGKRKKVPIHSCFKLSDTLFARVGH